MTVVMGNKNLLEIKNLRTYFYVRGYVAKAVDNVSLSIKSGETLAWSVNPAAVKVSPPIPSFA